MRFLRIEDCPITGAPRRKHTLHTDTSEFSEYLDACIRLAAELGIIVPDPREVDLTTWTEVSSRRDVTVSRRDGDNI